MVVSVRGHCSVTIILNAVQDHFVCCVPEEVISESWVAVECKMTCTLRQEWHTVHY